MLADTLGVETFADGSVIAHEVSRETSAPKRKPSSSAVRSAASKRGWVSRKQGAAARMAEIGKAIGKPVPTEDTYRPITPGQLLKQMIANIRARETGE